MESVTKNREQPPWVTSLMVLLGPAGIGAAFDTVVMHFLLVGHKKLAT